ncbi:MAG: PBPRA1643 family SWIM/SEC-C metal-binding motif protein [Thermodesulfobacteriota bacterium]|jgi:SWIM/SEC-C metal-binding protein
MGNLGSEKRPAVARVKSQKRAEEILSICSKHGWKVIVGVEPNKPEDISDVERLLNPPETAKAQVKTGRNDPCPCGSGKKYKRCCGG